MPEYEDYAAKAPPGHVDSGRRVAVEGKLRQVCKITDDVEGYINPRLALYIEVHPALEQIGVPLSKDLTDKLIATLISARNTIWPGK